MEEAQLILTATGIFLLIIGMVAIVMEMIRVD